LKRSAENSKYSAEKDTTLSSKFIASPAYHTPKN
jgi:hypothetical protein